jgi:putative oxidoreductase
MVKRNFVVFRALTSAIFVYAGTNHLFQSEKILGRLSGSPAYEMLNSPVFFSASVLLSGLAMIISGVLLALGYKQRLAAFILLIILIPITFTVQLNNLDDLGPFFKNVALASSLLFIINYSQNEIQNPIHRHIVPVD